MANETRDLKVTAELERRGDTDAIRQTAEELESLEPAAQKASGALGQIDGALSGEKTSRAAKSIAGAVADVSKQAEPAAEKLKKVNSALGPQGSEAARKIAEAVELLTRKTDAASFSAGRAVDAYEALGGSPTEFIARANTQLERAVILTADLQKQVDQLDEESREGLSGFADRAAKAKQRMEELRLVVDDLGEDEVPDLVQELQRLERQFEDTFATGAKRAANLEAEIENVEDNLKRMKDQARRGAGGVTDLTDAFRLQFPKASKAVAGAASSVLAFRTAFDETRKTISFLKQNFGIDVDVMVKDTLRLEAAADKLLEFLHGASDDAQTLFNQEKIFENFDLEGFTDDIEKNAKIIDDSFRKIGLAAIDARERLDGFNLDGERLVKEAEKFAQDFERALELNPDLDLKEFSTRAKAQIQSFLDSLIATGEKIPPQFQKMADQLGILPSAVEEQFNKLNDFLSSYHLDTEALIAQAQEFVANFQQALQLNPDLNLEAFGKQAKSAIQFFLDSLINAGKEIPPELQTIANQLGILPSAVEEQLNKATDAAQRILGELPGIVAQSREQLEIEAAGLRQALTELGGFDGVFQLDPDTKAKLKQLVEEVVNTYRSFGQKVDPLIADHANRLGVIVGAWERASEGALEESRKIAEAAQKMADDVEETSLAQKDSISIVVESLGKAGEVMLKQRTITREMAQEMTLQEISQAKPELKAYAEAVQEAQRQLILAGSSADEAATDLKKPADQAGEASAKVNELAGASQTLADASEKAGTALSTQADAITRISKASKPDGISKLRGELVQLSETKFAEPIVTQFDQIINKANEAFTAVQRLNEAGQDGAPSAPAPPAESAPTEVIV